MVVTYISGSTLKVYHSIILRNIKAYVSILHKWRSDAGFTLWVICMYTSPKYIATIGGIKSWTVAAESRSVLWPEEYAIGWATVRNSITNCGIGSKHSCFKDLWFYIKWRERKILYMQLNLRTRRLQMQPALYTTAKLNGTKYLWEGSLWISLDRRLVQLPSNL